MQDTESTDYLEFETFKNFITKQGLIGFGGYRITTKYNRKQELKKCLGAPKWKHINKENYLEYIGKDSYGNNHSSFYIRTGQEFGIVVLDFDTKQAYQNWITLFPQCKKYLTQNTKKGFHILFNYSKEFPTNESNAEHSDPNCKIDIRSKDGIIVAYPTKYYHHETKEEYKYEIYIDGKLGTISQEMIDYFDVNNMRRLPDAINTTQKLKIISKNTNDKMIKIKENTGEDYSNCLQCLMMIYI